MHFILLRYSVGLFVFQSGAKVKHEQIPRVLVAGNCMGKIVRCETPNTYNYCVAIRNTKDKKYKVKLNNVGE